MARPSKTLTGFCLSVTMAYLVTVAMGDVTCPGDKSSTTDTEKSTSTKVTWTLAGATCNRASGSPFQIGITTVTCTGTDGTTCSFRVTISDNENPTFSVQPENVRKAIPDFNPMLPVPWQAVSWSLPAASDNSGPTGDVFEQPSSTHDEGSLFPLGKTRVTYTARDFSGNEDSSYHFDVYVAVQPPDNHTFAVHGLTTIDKIAVRWPELDKKDVTKYYILHYQGKKDSDAASGRNSFTPDDSKQHTYIEQTVENLSPGELYSIEVGVDQSNLEEISTVQQWTKPSSPINLVFTPAPPSSAQFSWAAGPGGVEQYRVTMSNGRDLGYFTNTTNQITVDSLRPGTQQYIAYVRAVVGSGDKRMESSNAVSVLVSVPMNTSELVAFNYTESTIEVAWYSSSTSGNLNEPYMLFIVAGDGGKKPDKNFFTVFREDNSNTVATALFEGLQPNTEYHIRLISNLGLSLSTTQKTRPLRVSNIRLTEVLADSIKLEWDPPTEGDTEHTHEVYISPSPIKDYDERVVTGTSKVIQELTNGTEYFIRIVSIFQGMRSVPQTLVATTGVSGAQASSQLNFEALVVGIVLGVIVLLLVGILLMVCYKYGDLKNTSSAGGTTPGNTYTNDAADIQEREPNRRGVRNYDDDAGGMYETPEPKAKEASNPSSGLAYENTMIGASANPAPPPVKVKPKWGR